jgi:hypothetical protein
MKFVRKPGSAGLFSFVLFRAPRCASFLRPYFYGRYAGKRAQEIHRSPRRMNAGRCSGALLK